MGRGTVTHQLIEAHTEGEGAAPGEEIELRIDQTLTQDATGTLVMLELEAMGLERVETEVSAQYVDHNLLQGDFKNPDDHLFLRSAARRFGVHFSRPGNGVSHPVHMARLGRPGATLLGSDSHTCAAGALGMLAIGAGGLDVALAMTGEPFRLAMPKVWGIRLVGELPPWVGAKDLILELLRRHGVAGGVGRVLEYHGPGLAALSAMDRHVIANMGAELGATSSVFPSDDATRRFLKRHGREDVWAPWAAASDVEYDVVDEVVLSELVPLIAKPSSPGNVVPVTEVEGEPIYQSYLGSSANPGYQDLERVAAFVAGRQVAPEVSFDVNPASRELLENAVQRGTLGDVLRAGARLHQAGCNGCIGMGQAPASGRNSLRTTPRNFPGRSGTPEDAVWLCGPETVAASALEGAIADPRRVARELKLTPIRSAEPEGWVSHADLLEAPPEVGEERPELVLGPNVKPFPELEPWPEGELRVEVALKVGDDVSTDEILPAGSEVLPYRSNIPAISRFCFRPVDDSYADRAQSLDGPHAIVGGANYGQGSSREHAALAPAYLGLRVVLAQSYARIHRQNLINFGVLPLLLDPDGAPKLGEVVVVPPLDEVLEAEGAVALRTEGRGTVRARHDLSAREQEVLLEGGVIAWMRERMVATH